MNFMNSIKPSNFNETKIIVKLDLNLGSKYCTLLLSKIWYHLLKMELSILRNYQQFSNYVMKNQGENKNRNNRFDSLKFIHFTADLIGSLYIFHILLSNIL